MVWIALVIFLHSLYVRFCFFLMARFDREGWEFFGCPGFGINMGILETMRVTFLVMFLKFLGRLRGIFYLLMFVEFAILWGWACVLAFLIACALRPELAVSDYVSLWEIRFG